MTIDDQRVDVAVILIDGEELISALRPHELPFAKREGHPGIAGAYSYLPAQIARDHLLPKDDNLDDDGRIAILSCSCCDFIGCWPLMVRITVDDNTVRWEDFEQPHRSEHSAAERWAYEGFGPFVFDRKSYEDAVNALNG